MWTSSPSANTIARKPSYLGSYAQPVAVGQRGARARELGLDRRREGEGHDVAILEDARPDAISRQRRIRGVTPAHATVAEEEYLESLFWLFEAGLPMTGANLARAMQLSAPTVHEMLGRLERDGYITRNSERTITFTDPGREHAERIVSRHRMIERFLTDVVGVPWDEVHEEAEKLEHAMTPRFEAYVRSAVGRRPDLSRTAIRSASASASTACRWPTASRAPR